MSNARRRGFTLIELMVVIVILGGLVALVAPNVFQAEGQARNGTATFQIENFRRAIDSYYLRERNLPPTLAALTTVDPTTGEPWLPDVPPDPWGGPYEYRVTNAARREFTIVSSGRDRQEGTEDDVRYDSAAPRRRD
jgi:general secretion pathway protein G